MSQRNPTSPAHAHNGKTRTSISSLYYDTPHNLIIGRSMEKPTYKEKLRVRAYGTPAADDTVFVELKKKCRGITYKRRIALSREGARAYMAGARYEDVVDRFPQRDPVQL